MSVRISPYGSPASCASASSASAFSPSAADVQDFQLALQKEVAKLGF